MGVAATNIFYMTILETRIKLFEHFESNEIFDINKNFKNIVMVTDDEERDKAIILVTLKDLEKNGFVKKCNLDSGHFFYVLVEPFASISQHVHINANTSNAIAMIVNGYLSAEDNDETCDPSNIQEEDINMLIQIHLELVDIIVEMQKSSQEKGSEEEDDE